MSCEELFLKGLRQHGLRLTSQREVVLFVLHKIDHPATAEEIYAHVSDINTGIELSTVYRTLDLLNSMNLVTIIDIGDKQRLYERVEDSIPHLHLVCRVCGKISRIEIGLIYPLQDLIMNHAHFNVDLTNLTIPGVCDKCAQTLVEITMDPG